VYNKCHSIQRYILKKLGSVVVANHEVTAAAVVAPPVEVPIVSLKI
jgi:hypothetical protein